MLLIEDGGIIFDNYKKPINSARYLNSFFKHPLEHKKGIVIKQLDRILFLSYSKFHEKNYIISLINFFKEMDTHWNFYSQLQDQRVVL